MPDPVKSKYKVWDASYNNNEGAWIEYFFRTSADQVGEIYDGNNANNSLCFVSNRVSIKSGSLAAVPFAVTWENSKAKAQVSITGANIEGGAVAATSGGSLHYITVNDAISVALGKLDAAAYAASQSASGYIPLSGTSSLTGDIVPSDNNSVDLGSGSKKFQDIFGVTFHGSSFIGASISVEEGATNSGTISTGQNGHLHFLLTDGETATTNACLRNSSGTKYIAYEDWVTAQINALPTPMQFKGTIGSGGTIGWSSLPTAASTNNGWTYKVITDHDTAPICKAGDQIISNGSSWIVIPSGDEPSGTVTNVATGDGLTGGPITSTGTISHAVPTGAAVTASGLYKITTDKFGHVTGTSAVTKTDIPALDYIPLSGTSALAGDIVPAANNSRSLGSASYRMKNIYVGTKVNSPMFEIDGAQNATINMQIGQDGAVKFYLYDGANAWTNVILDNSGSGNTHNEYVAYESWVSSNFTKVTVASSAPSSPTSGNVWIDTSN